MIRNRLARRAAYGVLALLVQPIVVFGAANRLLSILGAADGQMKLLAETAQVDTDITIESNAATETKATFRVSPLRDAAGHLFPVTLTAAPPSPVPASPAPGARPGDSAHRSESAGRVGAAAVVRAPAGRLVSAHQRGAAG